MNKNTMKTYVLLAFLGGLFVLIGSFWGQGGATIGLALGLAMVGGSYWFSDKIAIATSRAKPVSESEAPELYRMTREMTQGANMPMPRLYMTPDPQPNAFATGRNDKKAVVAVTRGITEVLSPDELRGVIAHELAHIRNRDILIGSVAAAIAMSITFVARMAFWFGGGGRGRNNPLGIVGLLAMMILAPLAAMLIQAAISRSREYEADRIGARFAGGGEPLARALEKMQAVAKQAPMVPTPTAEAREHMYIVNPFGGLKGNLAGLFSTHPPTEERIARLRSVPR
ncbi:MAG: zinc metalloprotease HtpX [Actinomycetota bacterium]